MYPKWRVLYYLKLNKVSNFAGTACATSDLQGVVIVHICSGWQKVILDVFFMQRLVTGWCFSMKKSVPRPPSFLYLNVSLFSLFRIHYDVPFEKPECCLLVEFFFFFYKDYSSIVEPLFLLRKLLVFSFVYEEI